MRPPFQPKYQTWVLPDNARVIIGKLSYATDRVEVVFAFYAAAHSGQGPSLAELAAILSISKQNIQRRMNSLITDGRAVRKHGKFQLIESKNTHPCARKIVRHLEKSARLLEKLPLQKCQSSP